MDTRNVTAADTVFLLRETGDGSGTPVLLLHGVPQTSTVWRDVAPALAADGHRVLAPDLPGLGGSQYAGPYDTASVARQVVALLDEVVPGQRVDVVGHDWGGSVALALTVDRASPSGKTHLKLPVVSVLVSDATTLVPLAPHDVVTALTVSSPGSLMV